MFNLENFKILSFVLLCLCVFLSISCVCAADVNTGNTLNSAYDIGDLDGGIGHLSPGGEYNFDKNYTVGGDSAIDINANNVTINGNGYSINAYDHNGSLFNVFGDNVVIW